MSSDTSPFEENLCCLDQPLDPTGVMRRVDEEDAEPAPLQLESPSATEVINTPSTACLRVALIGPPERQ